MDADWVGKVGLTLAVLAVLWVLADWDEHRRRVVGLSRALHLSEPPPPQPTGPPIEELAADLRRIRTHIRQTTPGTPMARRRGWLEAYDDALISACDALGLEERIQAIPEGVTRDLERERVERLLEHSGVQLRLPD